jgi:hypothetical protein
VRQVTSGSKLSDWDLLPYRLYEASRRLFRISGPAALSTAPPGHAFIAMLPVLNSALIPRQAARSPVTAQLFEYAQIKPETSLIYFLPPLYRVTKAPSLTTSFYLQKCGSTRRPTLKT